MSLNRKFGHLADGAIVYAANPARIGRAIIFNPSAAQYLTIGEKAIDLSSPTEPAPTGYHYEADGYTEDAETIRRHWKTVADPAPAPRRWSRLSIKTAIATAGKMVAARAYMAAIEVAPGYTVWEALTDCDYIEEFWPTAEKWSQILDGAATAFGITRAEIDAFINSIPTDPTAIAS